MPQPDGPFNPIFFPSRFFSETLYSATRGARPPEHGTLTRVSRHPSNIWTREAACSLTQGPLFNSPSAGVLDIFGRGGASRFSHVFHDKFSEFRDARLALGTAVTVRKVKLIELN